MERVGLLIHKLEQQYQQQADIRQLMLTVQMLQKELALSANGLGKNLGTKKVAVLMPNAMQSNIFENLAPYEIPEEMKQEMTARVLQAEELITAAPIPEPLKPAAIAEPQPPVPPAAQPAPQLAGPVMEINNQVNLAASESLNDKLKEEKTELADVLVEAPVKDLRKAIGINDRWLYVNELFRGDEVMYERSIKTINNFAILPEAMYWIERELKVKLGWKEEAPNVQQFLTMVKRRFS